MTLNSGYTEDNASYLHNLDTQGNITGEMTDTHYAQDNETDSEMTTSEDTTTGDYDFLNISRISPRVDLELD